MSSVPRCKKCGTTMGALSSYRRGGGGSKHYYGLCECGEGRHRLCEECATGIAQSRAKVLCPDCGFPIIVEVHDTKTDRTTRY